MEVALETAPVCLKCGGGGVRLLFVVKTVLKRC